MVNVSIIIPFKNSAKTIGQCVKSLFSQSYRDFEVILVDNGSTDDSVKIADSLLGKVSSSIPAKIIYEKRPGPAAARNRGVAIAQGKYLAFTDSDCVADKEWLAETISAFDNASIAAVAGNIEGSQPTNLVDTFHSLFTLQGLKISKIFESFTLDTGGFSTTNLILRKDIFHQIGGFDEDLRYGEDHDLCARIYESGYKIKSIPKGTIYHIHRNDIPSTWRQGYHFGTGHGNLLRKSFNRYLLIAAGPLTFRSYRLPIRAWIDFDSADKKMAFLIAVSLFYWPASIFIFIYILYLSRQIAQRSKSANLKIDMMKCPLLAGLLFLKSAAMSAGRIQSAFKNRVICF